MRSHSLSSIFSAIQRRVMVPRIYLESQQSRFANSESHHPWYFLGQDV